MDRGWGRVGVGARWGQVACSISNMALTRASRAAISALVNGEGSLPPREERLERQQSQARAQGDEGGRAELRVQQRRRDADLQRCRPEEVEQRRRRRDLLGVDLHVRDDGAHAGALLRGGRERERLVKDELRHALLLG